MTLRFRSAILCVMSCAATLSARADMPFGLSLRDGWQLRSSAETKADGAAISQPGFDAAAWERISVPNTVVGALVEAGRFPDPYYGMNLRTLPGMDYPLGAQFEGSMSPNSPFRAAWWYRTEFELPAEAKDRHLFLRLDGINFRANVWLNGALIGKSDEIAGALRRHELEVSALARPGAKNALAIEVFAPEPDDLAFHWVDWNPSPPDKNMGLWDGVSLASSGPISLRNPAVTSELELPSLRRARLRVAVEVRNASRETVHALVRGRIGPLRVEKRVTLGPLERTLVRIGPEDSPALLVRHPRVWWPYRMGAQPLYSLALEALAGGGVSDRAELRFGIVQVSSELTGKGYRLFKINGKPILIRGAAYTPDMLLRQKSRERLAQELAYVRDMGLNAIRLEGKFESDALYELADEYGILLLPGLCCCDQWEDWSDWDDEDYRSAPAAVRDQLLRLRNHPSVLAWFNGSDRPPPAKVEQTYLAIERELDWQKPVLSSASEIPTQVSGSSGAKMFGPYDYVPPIYWYTDTARGGAFGFATEVSMGAAIPPLESLERMLPEQHLWPIDAVWRFHDSIVPFDTLTQFAAALEARYGKSKDAADFAQKSQALAYESVRAMFEAYARNKYEATGVIQWMLNNAWPSVAWHLYDYFLRPGGGYFGAKKACEPLHVQYSYDDRSVVVVNDTQIRFSKLRVSATLLDLELRQRFAQLDSAEVAPDSVVRVMRVPAIDDLDAGSYFLRLELVDARGNVVSHNFYWLSKREDELAWDKGVMHNTPTKVHGDLSALRALGKTELAVTPRFDAKESTVRVTVTNTGVALAFQVRLKLVTRQGGEELLPVRWEDNYFALLPGETRELSASAALPGRPLSVMAEAWNAQSVVAPVPACEASRTQRCGNTRVPGRRR